jgi:flagellar motor protein MotB
VGGPLSPALLLMLAACLPSPDGVSAQLEAEVRAARQRLATLESQGCEQDAPPHPVYAQLVQIFAGTEVEVEREGAGARLVIPADLLFTVDGVAVRREAAMVVDLLGTAIGLHGDLQIELRGHSDAAATADPMGRSLATARALMDALVAAHGLERGRFTVSGRGAGDPRSPGDTPVDRARNRRVEVWLLPGR